MRRCGSVVGIQLLGQRLWDRGDQTCGIRRKKEEMLVALLKLENVLFVGLGGRDENRLSSKCMSRGKLRVLLGLGERRRS